jgi:hypothetical protein
LRLLPMLWWSHLKPPICQRARLLPTPSNPFY